MMKHFCWHPQRKAHERTPCKPRYKQADKQYNGPPRRAVIRVSFAVTAVLVAIATACAMMLPAITMVAPDCGIEEHMHSDSCYRVEKTLLCDIDDPSHTHNDECYSEKKILVCEKPEHVHSDECYAQVGARAPNDDSVSSTDASAPPALGSGADSGTSAPYDPALDGYKDFEAFLDSVGGRIESFLYDKNNNLIDCIYEASGQGYTYVLKMNSPYIVPDTYYYYLPRGIDVDFASKTGDISNGTSKIGTYHIAEDSSYILFTFDEETVYYQNISGQITLSVSFAETMNASVAKTGWLISPEGESDGYFHFTISAKIPADREGLEKREWKLLDRSEITEQWIYDFGDPVNAANTHVYISFGDVRKREIFNIKDVYNVPTECAAYYVDEDTKYLYLVNRCICEDTALCIRSENDRCVSDVLEDYPGWCTCWGLDENAEVDIEYKTAVNGADGSYILQNQNDIAENGTMAFENRVNLIGTYRNKSGKLISDIKKASTTIEYSSFIEKEETVHATYEDGYVGEFRVTVNKQMIDLSKLDTDGDGRYDNYVVVVDSMENLKYITGSMRITATDMEENSFELTAGTDYTVKAIQTDNGTRLEINLKKLGRYCYQIDYSTQVFADESEKTVEIHNGVEFRIYDVGASDGNPKYEYRRRFTYDEEWDYLKFEVNVLKVDFEDHTKYLENAVFGLYSADDELIAQRTTDENGKALFATNVTEGLIFVTDTPYYLQEIEPPDGYDLNTTKYWFYFSETENTSLSSSLNRLYPGINLTRVAPRSDREYIAEIEITNEQLFTLPETGRGGVTVFIVSGIALLAAAAGCIILRHRLNRK